MVLMDDDTDLLYWGREGRQVAILRRATTEAQSQWEVR